MLFTALLIAFAALFLTQLKGIRADTYEHLVKSESLDCSERFAPKLRKPGLILVSGAPCFDPHGKPVAYNASCMFYWLGRKGFNICNEQQSLYQVRKYAERGAIYFLAEKNKLYRTPGFENELRENFRVVDECGLQVVFDLTEKPEAKKRRSNEDRLTR